MGRRPTDDIVRRGGYPPAMDPAGIPALQEAIRHLHGLGSTWLHSVPVAEKHEGATVWDGEVQVFAVTGHPTATRAYAWSHEGSPGKRRFHVVLGLPPVDSAVMAVRAMILADVKKSRN
jgi:hypothetical protein